MAVERTLILAEQSDSPESAERETAVWFADVLV
ncbi:MAG: hypothetical protein QOK22_3029 [Gaiellaceae bacterium]|jgi:nucleoside diphosphate kinase|nr:hypothetical protein [Gaiellaceae bacterium]